MKDTNATKKTHLSEKYPLFGEYRDANGLSGSELCRLAGYKARNPSTHAHKYVVENSLGEIFLLTEKELRVLL